MEIITDPLLLDELRTGWDALAQTTSSPLLSFDWTVQAAKAFSTPGALFVIVKRGSSELLDGIAPLARVPVRLISRATIIGTRELFEPSGFLFRNTEALKALISNLVQSKQPAILTRVPYSGAELQAIRDSASTAGIFLTLPELGSPWIRINSDWQSFEKQISARRRSDLRRAWRKASELGEIKLEITTPSAAEFFEAFKKFEQVDSASWKRTSGSSLQDDQTYRNFFCEFSRKNAERGELQFSFLNLNGRPIAGVLAIVSKRKLWVLKIGFDQEYARCSPGIIVMHETIKAAFEAKLEAFEFLGCEESWIDLWPHEVRPYVTIRLYPFCLKGLVAFAIDGLYYLIQRIAKSVTSPPEAGAA